MSFTFANTFVPAKNGSYAYFALKEHLKSVGWTVPRSSDGTTFNGTGDQITQAAAGAGGMDNPLAWFVIQSPDTLHSFAFQRASLGYGGDPIVDSKWWRIKVSVNGFTGGSATVVAAATDEGLLLGQGTNAAPEFNTSFDDSLNSCKSAIYYIGAETAAPHQFWACCACSAADENFRHTDGMIMMEAMAAGTFPPSDTDPFVYTAGTYYPDSFCYVRKGLSDETYAQVQAADLYSYLGYQDVNLHTLRTTLMPRVYIATSDGSPGSWKGHSSMAKTIAVDRGPFVPLTVTTPGDYISIGTFQETNYMFAVPWDGSVPDRSA